MSIILAIVIFSAIVLFHELGHFLLAKKSGIVVVEFSLGMGPRLLSTVKGGTRYSLKAFPIGGSCMMLGEDTDETLPGSFHAASLPGRICTVAAGPVFNFILAFGLSIVIVALAGYDPPTVASVDPESNAYAAGLREGDLITGFDGYSIDLARDLYVYMYMNPLQEGRPVRMTVKRDDGPVSLSFLPDENVRYLLGFNRSDSSSMTVESLIPGLPLEDAGLEPGDVITGIDGVHIPDGKAYDDYIAEHPLDGTPVTVIYVRDGLEYEVVISPEEYRTPSGGFSYSMQYVRTGFPGTLKYALLETKYLVRSTLLSLRQLITGRIGVKELSGPVGVVDAIGETYEESRREGFFTVLVNMLSMAVLLSANLGVMNLLPFPALDGGRLVFLILEAVRRKPVNREIEGSIHFTGLILLMLLMVFVMYNDILKLL